MTIFEAQKEEFLKDASDKSEAQKEALVEENSDKYLTALPAGEYKKVVLRKILEREMMRDSLEGRRRIDLYESEIEFLKSLPNDFIKRVFYSLICRAKLHPHDSGWIELDFKKTMKFGFPEAKASKIKIEQLAACKPYGFECRVVGSTNPILCFKVPVVPSGKRMYRLLSGQTLSGYQEVIANDIDKQNSQLHEDAGNEAVSDAESAE